MDSKVKNENLRMEFDGQLAAFMQKCEFQKSAIRNTVDSGSNACKALLLVAGGSAVSLLAYLGQMKNNSTEIDPNMCTSLILFSLAIILALLCSGLVYLTNDLYAQHIFNDYNDDFKFLSIGKITNFMSIACWVVSSLAIYGGFYYASKGLFSNNYNWLWLLILALAFTGILGLIFNKISKHLFMNNK